MAASLRDNVFDAGSGQSSVRRPVYGLWLFVFSVASNSLMLAMPVYLSQIYDGVLPSNSMDTLIYLSLFILFCILLFGGMEILRGTIAQKMSIFYELDTAPHLMDYAMRAKAPDARKITSLVGDVATVRQTISSRSFIGLFDLPFAPLFLLILFVVHPWLGSVALIGTVVLVCIAIANEMMARKRAVKLSQLYGQASARSNEILRHLDNARAMGIGETLNGRWKDEILQATLASNSVASVNNFFFGLVRFVRQAIQIAILGCGAYLVLAENLSAGLIFAASIVSGRALMPIEQFIGGWRQLAAARSAHKRVMDALQNAHQELKGVSIPLSLPELRGEVTCEKVSFVPAGLGPDKALLKEISFAVNPGEIIAVIGASGAGKTTLLRVLAKLIDPTIGKITYDGFDAGQWNPVQLGRSIGYSAQDSSFFNGTISDNIARFNDAATDEEVVAAAKRAGAHEFIGTLPDGYNTMVNSGEFRLSGGQRQRISLARAFFRDPQILVLDEPDAHLDQTGEAALIAAIKKAKNRKKLVLFATQRMHLVGCADKVLVLEDGKVARFGPRDEVFTPRSNKPIRKATSKSQNQATETGRSDKLQRPELGSTPESIRLAKS